MNQTQKVILIVAIALILGALGLWAGTGFHVLTKSEIPVEEIDELFGTKTIVWQEAFIVGLDFAGPATIAILAVAALLMLVTRRRNSTSSASTKSEGTS